MIVNKEFLIHVPGCTKMAIKSDGDGPIRLSLSEESSGYGMGEKDGAFASIKLDEEACGELVDAIRECCRDMGWDEVNL